MKHISLLFCLFCLLSYGAAAQEADSLACRERPVRQGYAMETTGAAIMGCGFGLAASSIVIGGASSVALMVSMFKQSGLGSDMVSAIFASMIMMVALVPAAAGLQVGLYGSILGSAGIPFYEIGLSQKNCESYWWDTLYNGAEQRGFTPILGFDLGTRIIQFHCTPGYNFDQHWFAGAGIAPTYYVPPQNYSMENRYLYLPAYANVRYSFGSKLLSPYLGISPGYDFLSKSFYGSAELGVRIRKNPHSTQSCWFGLQGELIDSHTTAGLKVSWSF